MSSIDGYVGDSSIARVTSDSMRWGPATGPYAEIIAPRRSHRVWPQISPAAWTSPSVRFQIVRRSPYVYPPPPVVGIPAHAVALEPTGQSMGSLRIPVWLVGPST